MYRVFDDRISSKFSCLFIFNHQLFIYFKNKTVIFYREELYKQLKDFDLTIIGTKCLPENLFQSEIGSFQAKYLLQVKFLKFYKYFLDDLNILKGCLLS
jgi:hypothetical protein